MNTHTLSQSFSRTITHTVVGYSLWLWFVKVGRDEGGAGEDEEDQGRRWGWGLL